MNFKDKNVIVTGGGSGLGACIAEEFAKAGANVVVVDRDYEKAKEVATSLKMYKVKTFSANTDVSNYKACLQLAGQVKGALKHIDILVNSAGVCLMGSIESMSLENLDAVVDIDLKGTMYMCKAVLPLMKEQHAGKVVNLSSIAGKLCGENTSIYSSVKAGIIALTASLGREYAKDGVNINCVLPGIIRTPMWEGMLEAMTVGDSSKKEEVFSAYENSIPQGKAQEPIDIANTVLYLCTEEAHCITGQNIGIDGGHTF